MLRNYRDQDITSHKFNTHIVFTDMSAVVDVSNFLHHFILFHSFTHSFFFSIPRVPLASHMLNSIVCLYLRGCHIWYIHFMCFIFQRPSQKSINETCDWQCLYDPIMFKCILCFGFVAPSSPSSPNFRYCLPLNTFSLIVGSWFNVWNLTQIVHVFIGVLKPVSSFILLESLFNRSFSKAPRARDVCYVIQIKSMLRKLPASSSISTPKVGRDCV